MQGLNHTTPSQLKSNAEQEEVVDSLPPIPDKRYFTIGEAAELCGLKPHVLRYWEQEFTQLKPAKRRGNRRFYQSKDLLVVRQIRQLLYEEGFTIEGARTKLSTPSIEENQSLKTDTVVKKLIADLETVLQNLKSVEEV